MLNITNCQNIKKEIGTIYISIFKDAQNGLSVFNIDADENVIHFSYAIEDTMKKFYTSFC